MIGVYDSGLGGLTVLVPHRKGYVIERDALLKWVRPAELGRGDR